MTVPVANSEIVEVGWHLVNGKGTPPRRIQWSRLASWGHRVGREVILLSKKRKGEKRYRD
jgi:hypothetical protein